MAQKWLSGLEMVANGWKQGQRRTWPSNRCIPDHISIVCQLATWAGSCARLVMLVGCLCGLIGCQRSEPSPITLTLATTTSTQDSGLLDALLPTFETQTGITVKVVAVGSGQALELGRRGDADLLLTHAPEAEQRFVADGAGIERREVMYNDFVLVGPAADPAGLRGSSDVVMALQQIVQNACLFVSRGDDSGTHQKEQELWKAAAVNPASSEYLEVGSGMAATLRIASEKAAYTLTDRATFLAQRDQLQLEVLSFGDLRLRNQYAVILVHPQRHPHVQFQAAQQFADFLLRPETQRMIDQFGRDRFGEPLFFPEQKSASTAVESTK